MISCFGCLVGHVGDHILLGFVVVCGCAIKVFLGLILFGCYYGDLGLVVAFVGFMLCDGCVGCLPLVVFIGSW